MMTPEIPRGIETLSSQNPSTELSPAQHAICPIVAAKHRDCVSISTRLIGFRMGRGGDKQRTLVLATDSGAAAVQNG